MITIEDNNRMKTVNEMIRERLERVCHELLEVYLINGDEKIQEMLKESMEMCVSLRKKTSEVISPLDHLDPTLPQPERPQTAADTPIYRRDLDYIITPGRLDEEHTVYC
jgi:hypothetical protein